MGLFMIQLFYSFCLPSFHSLFKIRALICTYLQPVSDSRPTPTHPAALAEKKPALATPPIMPCHRPCPDGSSRQNLIDGIANPNLLRPFLLSIPLVFVLFFAAGHAWAQTNSTQGPLTSMFNPANLRTNTYNDTTYNFSLLPPQGWIPVNQENKSDTALAVFSNENPDNEANFAIYYYKGNPITNLVLSTPDPLILKFAMAKLFDLSKFTVYQQNIQRFSDGFVIEAVVSDNQTKNAPAIEEFSFWLMDGRQYFLVLATSQAGFYQNAAQFERSVYTFYVGNPPSGTQIPPWVKQSAKWWSDGQIDDKSFLSGIEYLLEKRIITVPDQAPAAQASPEIPSWVKTSAGWWARGEISDSDFAKGIQYLVSNNIIKP